MTRRIITLAGIVITLFGLLTLIFIIKNPQVFNTRATSNEDPINIQITNVNDSQFTISYITNGKNIGTIKLGTDPNNLDVVVLDDRDQLSQNIGSYFVHHITPKDLNENTTYFFSINSGNKHYLNNNNPFSVTTGKKITSNPPTQNPISGNIITNSTKSFPDEGLIYLVTEGSQKISTLIQNGKYTFPLNGLLTSDLQNYKTIDQNSNLNIEAISDGLIKSDSINIKDAYPIQDIILTDQYSPKINSVSRGGIEATEITETSKAAETNITNENPSPSLKHNIEKNDIKKGNENNNYSVIIFGLGALIIVGVGLFIFFKARNTYR